MYYTTSGGAAESTAHKTIQKRTRDSEHTRTLCVGLQIVEKQTRRIWIGFVTKKWDDIENGTHDAQRSFESFSVAAIEKSGRRCRRTVLFIFFFYVLFFYFQFHRFYYYYYYYSNFPPFDGMCVSSAYMLCDSTECMPFRILKIVAIIHARALHAFYCVCVCTPPNKVHHFAAGTRSRTVDAYAMLARTHTRIHCVSRWINEPTYIMLFYFPFRNKIFSGRYYLQLQ